MISFLSRLAALLLLGCCWPYALGETFTVGTQQIDFAIPPGYVKAEGPAYEQFFRLLNRITPEDMRIHAVLVEKASDSRFRSKAEEQLADYLIVCSNDRSAEYDLDTRSFGQFKLQLMKTVESQLGSTIKDRSNRMLQNSLDATMRIDDVQLAGILRDNDKQISYLTLMRQVVNLNGKTQTFTQANLGSYLLVGGKLITVNQYRFVADNAETARFRQAAPTILDAMAFSSASSGSGEPLSLPVKQDNLISEPSASYTRFWIGAVIVLLLVVGIWAQRRQRHQSRRKGPANGEPPGQQ